MVPDRVLHGSRQDDHRNIARPLSYNHNVDFACVCHDSVGMVRYHENDGRKGRGTSPGTRAILGNSDLQYVRITFA